jgi:hypothetical protein
MIISVRELKPGMSLLRDLIHDGHTILKAKSMLSAAIISVLKIRGVSHVDAEEIGSHIAPGADVYYKMALDSKTDMHYQGKKEATEKLFATADADAQTLLLKYCIMSQLEEKRVESN